MKKLLLLMLAATAAWAQGVLSPSRLKQDGATTGQCLVWNGTIWAPGSCAGIINWGEIQGTLANQTDLQNALNAKVAGASGLVTVGRLARTSAAGTVADSTGIFEDATGNVGIGTTNPLYKLDVNGHVRLSRIYTNAGSGDNIDFDSGYAYFNGIGLQLMGNDITNVGNITVGNGSGNDELVFTAEATNPACPAGKFSVWANSADAKLKKCQNGTISDWDTNDGGTGGAANVETTFTGQTSVTVTGATHGFGHAKILTACYDNSTPAKAIIPQNVTVNASSYDVVFTFAAATTGKCVLNGSGGGTTSVAWGAITGTLSDQSDLNTALTGKADSAAFTAHTGNTSNPHSVTAAQVGAADSGHGHASLTDGDKGDITFSSGTATIDSGAVTVAKVASPLKTGQIHIKIWGTGTSSVLQDTDDEATIWRNEISALTISKVVCESDTGSPTIQLQKDDGSPANMFASALTCDATPSGTDGTDGILTSFASGENGLAVGDRLDHLTVTAGGSAHWVAITVVYTLD